MVNKILNITSIGLIIAAVVAAFLTPYTLTMLVMAGGIGVIMLKFNSDDKERKRKYGAVKDIVEGKITIEEHTEKRVEHFQKEEDDLKEKIRQAKLDSLLGNKFLNKTKIKMLEKSLQITQEDKEKAKHGI